MRNLASSPLRRVPNSLAIPSIERSSEMPGRTLTQDRRPLRIARTVYIGSVVSWQVIGTINSQKLDS